MRAIRLAFAFLLVAALVAPASAAQHRLLIHVDSPDPAVMTEALHNAANVVKAMRAQGDQVAIEIVANGPGTSMLIEPLSPVKDDVRRLHAAYPDVVLSACGVSLAHMEATMKRKLPVMTEARVVPSGAVRIMELEEQHWTYLKP
ncbi:MAG: hypothetical protein ACREF3_11395 [Acetobacteraceae bacterium]